MFMRIGTTRQYGLEKAFGQCKQHLSHVAQADDPLGSSKYDGIDAQWYGDGGDNDYSFLQFGER